mgnify:CR=1 FL=1
MRPPTFASPEGRSHGSDILIDRIGRVLIEAAASIVANMTLLKLMPRQRWIFSHNSSWFYHLITKLAPPFCAWTPHNWRTVATGARSRPMLASMFLGVAASGLNSLTFGPGSLELRLLAAKLAARNGGDAALFAGADEKAQKRWRSLMYGKEYGSADADAPGCARVLTTAEELGASLSAAEALVLVCDSAPLEDSALGTLFNNAGDDLRRVVLISKMGVTRAKPGGPFGIGGGDAAIAAGEAALRKATSARGVDLSIIRVGTLKGGGPGVAEGDELGLSQLYYDGIGDLTAYMTTQSYDKFTNGAKVLRSAPSSNSWICIICAVAPHPARESLS